MEQFIPFGIINDAENNLIAILQRDRDTVKGKTMSKVGGAVKRIDDPFEIGT